MRITMPKYFAVDIIFMENTEYVPVEYAKQ
jgi:hypothetical protein